MKQITPEQIAQGGRRLGSLRAEGTSLYWIESIPHQNNRRAIMRSNAAGEIQLCTPEAFQVKTRVNEYGGGEYLLTAEAIYFLNDKDQCWYAQSRADYSQVTPLHQPLPVKHNSVWRLADPGEYKEGLLCIAEQHIGDDVTQSIVRLTHTDIVTIAVGADFYAAPRMHEDKLCYLCWFDPAMPWTGTELVVQDHAGEHIIWGSKQIAVSEPAWGPDGALYFIADHTGWANLYRYIEGEVESLCPMNNEFGLPLWVLGIQTYCLIDAETLIATCYDNGQQSLIQINLKTKAYQRIECDFTDFGDSLVAFQEGIAFIGASPTHISSVIYLNLRSNKYTVIRCDNDLTLDATDISVPQFLTERGTYGFYYPPVIGPVAPAKKPPLLVLSHGGPTAYNPGILNLKIQFWTQRGVAVLDVNYRGSTGFGRAYRESLNGQWGIFDIEDCIALTEYLVERGEVDPNLKIIKGGSAGGFTTLSALSFHDYFNAGISYYGVADLTALAESTHRFERYYLDSLVGKYPEEKALYDERSPLYHLECFNKPVLLLQGLEDRVVPPSQAEALSNALSEKGIPFEYLVFEGEGHGFRGADAIIQALKAEWDFVNAML